MSMETKKMDEKLYSLLYTTAKLNFYRIYEAVKSKRQPMPKAKQLH